MKLQVLFTVDEVITLASEKDKLDERKYLPKTLIGLVNPRDRSYAAAAERTRVFTGLKMGRKLLFTMNCEMYLLSKDVTHDV